MDVTDRSSLPRRPLPRTCRRTAADSARLFEPSSDAGSAGAGLELTPAQRTAIEDHARLLLAWNEAHQPVRLANAGRRRARPRPRRACGSARATQDRARRTLTLARHRQRRRLSRTCHSPWHCPRSGPRWSTRSPRKPRSWRRPLRVAVGARPESEHRGAQRTRRGPRRGARPARRLGSGRGPRRGQCRRVCRARAAARAPQRPRGHLEARERRCGAPGTQREIGRRAGSSRRRAVPASAWLSFPRRERVGLAGQFARRDPQGPPDS